MNTQKKPNTQTNRKLKVLFWVIPTCVITLVAILYILGLSNNSTMWSSSSHTQDMQNLTINSEMQYLIEMIPHHQEAIDTARIIAASTTNSGVKQLTDTMVIVQSNEVEQLDIWKKQWYARSSYRATYRKMMPDLTKQTGTAQDLAFLNAMIIHHQMAIIMSEQVLKLNPHEQVNAFAKEIIKTQTQEIAFMKRIAGSLV